MNNFEYGGSVFINDYDRENFTWFLLQKFGYIAYVVDDDINCMKNIEDCPLVAITFKRKIRWYKIDYGKPNLQQFKERILNV